MRERTAPRPPVAALAALVCALGLGAACAPPGDDDDAGDDDAVGDDDTDDDGLTLPVTVEVVVRRSGDPASGARVLQGGTSDFVLADADGRASLDLVAIDGGEVWVVAALAGHRSVGEQLFGEPAGPIELELLPVDGDNDEYEYGPAGVDRRDTTAYCSHCHISTTAEFADSAHAEAARDEQVHDLYAGTAAAFDSAEACAGAGGRWLAGTLPGGAGPGTRCYIGSGLLPDASPLCGSQEQPSCDDPALPLEDAPLTTGRCADCHAPAVGGPLGGGHSLLDVEGLAYEEGVTCDFCHKVGSIDREAPPGVGGRTVLGRPNEPGDGFNFIYQPVMYGPYADVLNPFMGGSLSSIFSDGELCAGCHEYAQEALWPDAVVNAERWPDGRLPVHSTWSEWAGSTRAPGTPCQACHMPPTGALNSADIEELGGPPGVAAGFHRPPDSVRDHGFLGPLDQRPGQFRLLDVAAAVLGEARIEGGELVVEASVTNFGAGHALPTGEPLRSMALLVRASCDGEELLQTAGPTLSPVSGALATGVVGEGVEVDGDRLLWPGLDVAADGSLRVSAMRPTGVHLDYEGVGRFGTGADGFAAADKGLPETLPLGSRSATAAVGEVTLSDPLSLQAGDIVTLGEGFAEPVEGGEARMLAGLPGMDFARVLADVDGAWPVPHHRAVDVIRDNRLLPAASDSRAYRFELPGSCTDPEATAYLLYRRYPPRLARERGWPSTDHPMDIKELAVP